MSSKSKIEWTDATWNPVLGCSKISPGCKHCYAIKQVHRMASNPNPKIRAANEGLTVIRPGGTILNWTGKLRIVPERLDIPLRTHRATRFFVNSLSDLFHEDVPLAEIDAVFDVMRRAERHTFQVLTKRANVMFSYMDSRTFGTGQPAPPNVHLGVSVEDRKHLGRIKLLRATPAAVRFLSLEPLLEDLGELDLRGIHWVIVGGESGGKVARPLHPKWVRSIRDQCQRAGVAFLFKQWGAWKPIGTVVDVQDLPLGAYIPESKFGYKYTGKKRAGRILDGRTWDEYPRVAAHA